METRTNPFQTVGQLPSAPHHQISNHSNRICGERENMVSSKIANVQINERLEQKNVAKIKHVACFRPVHRDGSHVQCIADVEKA